MNNPTAAIRELRDGEGQRVPRTLRRGTGPKELRMRIGVSGTHGVGKTALVEALCARLTDHTAVDEPYLLLEEEGYEFEHPPSLDDYRTQLSQSLRTLRSPVTRVVFDRTPLDFLAYLAAHELNIEAETDTFALRAALESLDLLVVVPITDEAERVLPGAEMLRLRQAVNGTLLDLVYDDPLEVCGAVPVIELAGRLDGRLAAVLAALPDDPQEPASNSAVSSTVPTVSG